MAIRLHLKEKLTWWLDISNPALSSSGELSVTINGNSKTVVSQFFVDKDGNLNAVEEETKYIVPVDSVELINGNVIVTY